MPTIEPLNEADTRAKLVDPAIHKYGWTEDHIKREEALLRMGENLRKRLTIDWTKRESVRVRLCLLVKHILRKLQVPTNEAGRSHQALARASRNAWRDVGSVSNRRVMKSLTVDWSKRESVRARLRLLVKRILRKYKYPPTKQDEAIQLVLAQAEMLGQTWAA